MDRAIQGQLNFQRSTESSRAEIAENAPVASKTGLSPLYFFNGRLSARSDAKLTPAGPKTENERQVRVHLNETTENDKNGKTFYLDAQKNIEPAYLAYYHKLWNILEAHLANPLSSLVTSKTMLLPHQVQAALHVVESIRPRILIADEVGLGKTVEAGLIIKELLLKQNSKSVLIAVPAPLVYQWQSELKHKFNEHFAVVTGPVLRKRPDLIKKEDKIIVSIDLLRDKDKWPMFLEKDYDIVVFDEAHRLRKDNVKATKAYQFAEQVSKNTRALILLSATPFRGKLEEIYYLVQLIDPDILGPYHSFLNTYGEDTTGALRDKLSPVVIRRRKIDIGGFTKRFAKTIKLTLPPLERSFYDEVTEYVKKEYNRAIDSHQHVRAFVAVVFQKLLDSSSYALLNALKKRRERLEKMYYRIPKSPQISAFEPEMSEMADMENFSGEMLQDLLGEDGLEDALLEESVFDPKEIRQEILSLSRLISLGEKIETDYKLLALFDTLKKLKKNDHEKIIIFTQFKRTMEYIYDYIKDTFKTTVFHGGLSGKDKEAAIEEFYNSTDVLICTEAGGEGRNLQTASALINYDLPWSPLKVEQRIGRIHRFGQKKDVYIVNFASKDTIAEKVIDILEKKIKIFEDAFGASDILLGMTEDDSSIENSLLSLLQSKKSKKDYESELQQSLKAARDNLHKIENLVSTEVLNFNMHAFDQAMETKRSGAQTEEEIEQIVTGVYELTNPIINKRKNKNISNGEIAFNIDGKIGAGTFSLEHSNNKGYLDYLTLGHPYVDSALQNLVSKLEPDIYYEIETSKPDVCAETYFFEAKIHLDRVYHRRYSITLGGETSKPGNYKKVSAPKIDRNNKQLQRRLEQAIQGIYPALSQDVEKLLSKTRYGVNFWKENIQNSFMSSDTELQEKLEIQQGKAHWYGEDRMSGAIRRTINRKKTEKSRVQNKIFKLENQLKLNIDLIVKHICAFNVKNNYSLNAKKP